MSEYDFTERELSDFKSFKDFGELPEDLRTTGPISTPDGSYLPPSEGDMYGGLYGGGAARGFVEPIPAGLGQQFSFAAINYLPRANAESFRSQRFAGFGSALLPPDPTTFVDLFVDISSLGPTPPQKQSSGILSVPQGYAAVITGIRQWIGDASAFQKPTGDADDIVWRVVVGGTSLFNFGNFPIVFSSLENEGKLYGIANESTTIQLSVKNNIDPSSYNARDIAIKGAITGHWFPIDEIDDIFRNR